MQKKHVNLFCQKIRLAQNMKRTDLSCKQKARQKN